MRKFLVLLLLALLLTVSVSEESAMALDDGGNENGNDFRLIRDEVVGGYLDDEGEADETSPAPDRNNRNRRTAREPGGEEPVDNWLTRDEFQSLVQAQDPSELIPDQFQTVFNVETDTIIRRTTLHWTWVFNNLSGSQGDARRQTEAPTIRHIFGHVGTYNITATPWTRFREYQIIRYTVYVEREVDIPPAQGIGPVHRTTVMVEDNRSHEQFVSSWEAYDTGRQMNFTAIIGIRDKDEEIEFPNGNTSLPPLPPLKYEITE